MKQERKRLILFFYSLFASVFMPFFINAQTKAIKTSPTLTSSRATVEANINNWNAHLRLSNAAKVDSIVDKQYAVLVRHYPNDYVIPFSIGKWYIGHEDPKAKKYLLRAISLKPDLAEAWYLLWEDGLRWGDRMESQRYLETAARLEPNNPDYAFYYAYSFKGIENSKYDSLSLELIPRFPDSERGAQALFGLAHESRNQNEKITYYEQLYARYTRYAGTKTKWFEAGMNDYFVLLLDINPDKALELAIKMLFGGKQNWRYWHRKIQVAKGFKDASIMLAENESAKAAEILDKINFGSRNEENFIRVEEILLLFKARVADAAGKTNEAYDSLMVAYSKAPMDDLRKPMFSYAMKLGKDSSSVYEDIWKQRDSTSIPATEFTLKEYINESDISLSDYKGKLLLLTNWFPGCGPCRAEFPHLENVIKKIEPKDLGYVGINIIKNQDGYVIPFMKASGYSFIPLHDDSSWRANSSFNKNDAPRNYLIDQRGRIVFKDFIINESNERMLELMITELLNREDIGESKIDSL